jgi:hypothetical protein
VQTERKPLWVQACGQTWVVRQPGQNRNLMVKPQAGRTEYKKGVSMERGHQAVEKGRQGDSGRTGRSVAMNCTSLIKSTPSGKTKPNV